VKFGNDSAPKFGGDEVLAFFLPCPEVYELGEAHLFEVVIIWHVPQCTQFGGVVLHSRCVGVYSMGNYYEGEKLMMGYYSDQEIAAQVEVGDRYPTRKSLRIARKRKARLTALGWFMVGASFATSVAILLVSL